MVLLPSFDAVDMLRGNVRVGHSAGRETLKLEEMKQGKDLD